MSFREKIDIVFCIFEEMIENEGEDNYFCSLDDTSSVVSVFDGCGGLGARSYHSFKGKTGAYMASRILSGAMLDWYHSNAKTTFRTEKDFTDSINTYIKKAYRVCLEYADQNSRIRGSMVRDLPSTMAMAFVQDEEDDLVAHVVWAGDSRVYLLDENGLAQLTIDDLDITDAMKNLHEDGVLNNVISSDGNYHLNYRKIYLNNPCIILAATDGCFNYIPSPMEFEQTILTEMVKSESVKEFEQKLHKTFCDWASDDFTLGYMSFMNQSFDNTKKRLMNRYKFISQLTETFMNGEDRNNDVVIAAWEKYKKNYSRYL